MTVKRTICSVTVLYRPGDLLIENLKSYMGQIDCAVIVDNSETRNEALYARIKRAWKSVHLIVNEKNLGVARALNQGMDYAMEQGCRYALLMDQDSSLHEDTVMLLRRALEENERAFIAAPLREDSDLARLSDAREEYTRRLTCVSSGSLVNLEYVKDVGLHDERLFIDLVDHEYCLRAGRKGYRIIIANRARMRHRLGRMEERKLFGLSFYPTHHSPLRKYYKARNSLYVWSRYLFRYPRYVLPGIGTFLKEYLETLLFEKDKMKKSRAILAGIVDYFAGRFGECARPEFTGEGAR